jgi:phosphoglycerate dehydrogenase-like enzyme
LSFPAELVAAARSLKLLLHQGVGYPDTVDVDALRSRGIRLAVTLDGTSDSAAELTVLLILAVCRHLVYADNELRRGRFHRHALRAVSPELTGRTVGYIGMGRIAKGAAKRLKAFGTTGIYCNRSGPLPQAIEREFGISHSSFERVVAEADILTLHVPLGPATGRLIDAAVLSRMKPGGVLINTARGGLIDEDALCAALKSGHLLGAGLDVFAREPVHPDDPLCALPNVVLTPHYANGTIDAFRHKMRSIFDNVSRFQRGEPLLNEVVLG